MSREWDEPGPVTLSADVSRALAALEAAKEATEAIALKAALGRYIVGYYCHKGSGHFEMYGDPNSEMSCGSSLAPLYLDEADAVWFAETNTLPPGRWENEATEGGHASGSSGDADAREVGAVPPSVQTRVTSPDKGTP